MSNLSGINGHFNATIHPAMSHPIRKECAFQMDQSASPNDEGCRSRVDGRASDNSGKSGPHTGQARQPSCTGCWNVVSPQGAEASAVKTRRHAGQINHRRSFIRVGAGRRPRWMDHGGDLEHPGRIRGPPRGTLPLERQTTEKGGHPAHLDLEAKNDWAQSTRRPQKAAQIIQQPKRWIHRMQQILDTNVKRGSAGKVRGD